MGVRYGPEPAAAFLADHDVRALFAAKDSAYHRSWRKFYGLPEPEEAGP